MPSPWVQRMARELEPAQPVPAIRSRPRCMADTLKRSRCKRGATVRISTILGGTYCRTHGRRMEDREVARVLNSQRVLVEEL